MGDSVFHDPFLKLKIYFLYALTLQYKAFSRWQAWLSAHDPETSEPAKAEREYNEKAARFYGADAERLKAMDKSIQCCFNEHYQKHKHTH